MNLQSPQLYSEETKRSYNKRLFSVVAPRYALATRLLSLGADSYWKRNLIRMIPQCSPVHVCDLACGTGDIKRLLHNRFPAAHIMGLDLSAEMMRCAPDSNDISRSLVRGDMHQLPFPDNSIDLITGGYALRNAPNITTAIREIARVLAPGGVAAFLDFSKPVSTPIALAHNVLLHSWGSLIGLALHADPNVYAYIARSLSLFPNRAVFTKILNSHGLNVASTRNFYGGMLQATVCIKNSSSQ